MTSAALTEPADEPDIGKLGMWVFIASEVLFFGGLFVAYLYGRMHLPAGWAEGSRHTDVLLGTAGSPDGSVWAVGGQEVPPEQTLVLRNPGA